MQSTFPYTGGNPFTVFAVGVPDVTNAFQAIFASQSSGGRQVAIESTAQLKLLREASTANTYDGGVFVVGVPYAFGASFDATPTPDLEGFQMNDGAYQSKGLTISSLGTGNLRIGARSNSTNFYNGALAELILYNRALTSAEFASNLTYLRTKWGIPTQFARPAA